MQIFSDKATTATLERYLEHLQIDCIIVDLEQPDDQGLRSTAVGMTLVPMLSVAYPTTPIIMVGWQTVTAYERDPRWQIVINLKNVTFRRLPVVKDDVLSAISEVNERLTQL